RRGIPIFLSGVIGAAVVVPVMRAVFGEGPDRTAAQWAGMAAIGVLCVAVIAVLASVGRRRRRRNAP
ncbi:MAG: hypothetical protein J2P28_26040, partial [Actinobacteria bacterium]|nr:hypothetical protein [Actinomycetota bacterium]